MRYSSNSLSTSLLSEIKEALQTVNYGSIEIYVQDKKVTQITVRNIKKTSVTINGEKNSEPDLQKRDHNKIKVLTTKKQ